MKLKELYIACQEILAKHSLLNENVTKVVELEMGFGDTPVFNIQKQIGKIAYEYEYEYEINVGSIFGNKENIEAFTVKANSKKKLLNRFKNTVLKYNTILQKRADLENKKAEFEISVERFGKAFEAAAITEVGINIPKEEKKNQDNDVAFIIDNEY